LEVWKTPERVPAYKTDLALSNTRESVGDAIPEFDAVQDAPASVLRYGPTDVPANRVAGDLGSTAIAQTFPAGRPLLAVDQLVPALDDLKTPPAVAA
jgi:hypothetical protein